MRTFFAAVSLNERASNDDRCFKFSTTVCRSVPYCTVRYARYCTALWMKSATDDVSRRKIRPIPLLICRSRSPECVAVGSDVLYRGLGTTASATTSNVRIRSRISCQRLSQKQCHLFATGTVASIIHTAGRVYSMMIQLCNLMNVHVVLEHHGGWSVLWSSKILNILLLQPEKPVGVGQDWVESDASVYLLRWSVARETSLDASNDLQLLQSFKGIAWTYVVCY